jgi:histone acetyltransferase (RNA polymerase elongator complex component)
MKHINIPIFIPHLGCPFQCIFCNQKNIAQKEEAPEPETVAAFVSRVLASINIPRTEVHIEVAYFGGSFTAINPILQENYLKALAPFLNERLIDGIRISTRPDCITENILKFLLNNGVTTIELGVQSLNNEVLIRAGRGYTAQDVIKAGKLIREKGIKLGIQLMVGLPGDNYEHDIETTEATIALQPDMVRIYPVLVIKDTKLEEWYKDGRYQGLELQEAVETSCDMLLRFEKAEIDVIRIGLHASEELRGGAVVAGPFHPAFGELVEQEAFKRQAQALLSTYKLAGNTLEDVHIYVNQRDLSKMLGPGRSNILYLNNLSDYPYIKDVKTNKCLQKNEIAVGSAAGKQMELVLNRKDFIKQYLDI